MRIYLLSRGPYLYSTQSLLLAAKRLGHKVEVLDPAMINTVISDARVVLSYQGEQLAPADIVIGRFSPTFTTLGADLLSQFAAAGALVSPQPNGLMLARNKWRAQTALQAAGVAMPTAAMLNDSSEVEPLVKALGGHPIIIKLLESTHGSGVMISHQTQSTQSIVESFAGLQKGVLLQEYIKESGGRDLRVIVCGSRVVAAMERVPAEGEFRSNLHRGGSALRIELTPDESDLAIRATKAVGLQIAGVDILRSHRGPLVMEVNASPGLEGIEATTNIDVASAIISHLAKAVQANEK